MSSAIESLQVLGHDTVGVVASVPPASPRILIVDDTPSIHGDFKKILCPPPADKSLATEMALFGGAVSEPRRRTFQVEFAFQGQEGLACVQHALAQNRPFSIAFVDMRMPPGWDGIETIRRMWAVDPLLQIVICTAYSDYSWEAMVRAVGESDNLVILKKPFENIEVLQLAHALAKKWEVTARDRNRLAELDQIVQQRTAALRSSEGRFSAAFHANPLPVTLQELATGKYLDFNDAFLQLIGAAREAVFDRSPADLGLWLDGDVVGEMSRRVDEHHPLSGHRTALRTTAGKKREVRIFVARVRVGSLVCLLTSIEDVTETLHLEQQLRHSQKMDAIGQLAAGVAHDFNNLLTIILSYASLAMSDACLGTEVRAQLGQVRSAAERAAALTRQLLIFSRKQVTQPSLVNPATVVGGLREMLSRLIPERIQLRWTCPEALPPILADEANLEQIIVNLVVNARDAIPNAGEIDVRLDSLNLTVENVKRHPERRAGAFIRFTVADNGSGIDPAILTRIFEPFFTTKDTGKGTGLGLSTVYALVHQHSGWIEVASTMGEGTRFELFFPVDPNPRGEVPRTVVPTAKMPALLSHERILFVEDDPVVRDVTTAILKRTGCQLWTASDGPTALATWKAQEGKFDLLLTDMVMPNGISGADLATRLRAEDPQLKVLFSTGYSPLLVAENDGGVRGARLLPKPYTRPGLLRAIREVLDAPVA